MNLYETLTTFDVWNELGTSLKITTADGKKLYDSEDYRDSRRGCYNIGLNDVHVKTVTHEDAYAFTIVLDIESRVLYHDIELWTYVTLEELMLEYCDKSLHGELTEDCGFSEWLDTCMTHCNGTLEAVSTF